MPVVVKEKPALANVEPFKTVLTGDFEKIGKLSLRDFETIAVATLTGMSVDDFAAEARRGSTPPRIIAGSGYTPS